MKRLSIIAALCCVSLFCKAQAPEKKKASPEKVISDKMLIRAYYQFNKRNESSAHPYRTDTLLLDIGQNISKFYDPARQSRDSLVKAKMANLDISSVKRITVYKSDAIDIPDMPGAVGSNASEGESYQIVKKKPGNEISVYDYTQALGDRFKFDDKFEPLVWNIVSETNTVLSYVCQMATTRFRGRNFKAWFTTDIPVNDGPWKLSGLPGLIVKAEDDKGLFSFELVGLERAAESQLIRIDGSQSIACTRAEFEKLKGKKQNGGVRINVNAGDVIMAEIPVTTPLISIELE